MKINQPIFETAYIDGRYSMGEFNKIMAVLVEPEQLDESDTTLINFAVQSFNDQSKKLVTIIDLVKTLRLNQSNASNRALLAKINTNRHVESHLNEYFSNKKKENRRWLSGFAVFAVLALLFALNSMGYLNFNSLGAGSKVVVIDINKLAVSATADALNKKLNPEQSQKYATDYRNKLQAQIESYTKKGYVVVDRANIFAVDEKLDVTNNILKNIGIKPASIPEFDKDYTDLQKYDAIRNFANSNVNDLRKSATEEILFKSNQEAATQMDAAEIYKGDSGQSIDLE